MAKVKPIRTGVSRDALPRPTVVRGGAVSVLTDEEATAADRALDTVLDTLGGRGALLDTLAVAADAPEVEPILTLLLDPRYEKFALRRLCTLAGITVVELFTAYRKALITTAHLQAYKAITDGIGPVVEDVLRRAAPYEVPCHACGGSMYEPDGTTVCTVCRGHGALLELPDLDRQKLALELAQLVQKAGGLQIQQNNLTLPASEAPRVGAAGNTLIDLQHAVREILSGPRTPLAIEAEIVDPPPPTPPDAA